MVWSKDAFRLFVWFAAFWFLLACGIALAATRVAINLFDYNGEYTPELVAACLLVGLIGGWVMFRRFKRSILHGDDRIIKRVKEAQAREYQRLSKAERLRQSLAWIASGVVFCILDFIAYQTTLRLFPDLTPRTVILMALTISCALAALFGVAFYRRVLPKIFPDGNEGKTSPN